LSWQFKR